jgi:hypothetical protein
MHFKIKPCFSKTELALFFSDIINIFNLSYTKHIMAPPLFVWEEFARKMT